jgi:hypothetical protein
MESFMRADLEGNTLNAAGVDIKDNGQQNFYQTSLRNLAQGAGSMPHSGALVGNTFLEKLR